MRFFPQLETHTAGQYPLTRERHERVVRYESLDGRMRTYFDGQAGRVLWSLRYDGLTDSERAAIDALYQECEGRLQTFIFLDPAANLLRWSEDYTQGAWTVDPLLFQEQGWDDPWNTTRGTRFANIGIAPQRIAQTITASGQHQYCLSAYVGGTGQFRLRIDSGGFIEERAFTSHSAWKRYSVSFRPGSDAEQVTFSLYLEPGQSVKVCGMQADAQPAPGGYRRTTSRSGVYLEARFAEDELTWVQQAPDHNAAEILIESRPF